MAQHTDEGNAGSWKHSLRGLFGLFNKIRHLTEFVKDGIKTTQDHIKALRDDVAVLRGISSIRIDCIVNAILHVRKAPKAEDDGTGILPHTGILQPQNSEKKTMNFMNYY